MSEYVPTTEEVRADYAETYEGTNELRYARFDRWLAAHDAEVAAMALEEKGYFLKGHAEWTRSNFLPGPHSDACAKYNDEIGDELIEDAAELRARAAEIQEGKSA